MKNKPMAETAKSAPNVSSRSHLGERAPRLRFHGFGEDWSEKKFGSVFDFIPNNTLARSELVTTNGRVRNIHYGDILVKFGSVIDVGHDEIPFIANQDKATFSRRLKDGDVIIADTAEDETVGKATELIGLYGAEVEAGLHTMACRPRENFAPKFLGYCLNSSEYHRRLIPLMQGIKVLSLSKSQISGTNFFTPSQKSEQEKIASFLSLVDSRIDKLRRLVELLKKHKRGAIEKLFSSHRWPEVPLGEIAEINPKPSKINDEFFYADLESVEDGVLKNLNLVQKVNAPSRAQRTVQVNDILFQMVRPYQQNNYLARHTFDKQLIASTGYAQLRTKEDPEFIYWQLHTKRFLQCVLERCTGSGYPAINASDLKDISVRIAPRTEQQKIAQVLRSLADKSVAEEKLIHRLETLKRALLQQLFV